MDDQRTPPPRLLHEFFDAAARLCPDRIAVDVPPGPDRPDRACITYCQLAAEAESLAVTVASFIAEPDTVVGILLPRNSRRLYAAQLAVLKAGAAFTCIDQNFPDAHLQAVLDDGDISLLLTDHAGLARIEQASIRIRCAFDIAAPPPPATHPRSPAPATGPTNLAYVIYTSGTTGAPKGVMIEHASVINLVASDLAEFALTPDDRVGQSSSPAYDSSIEETWLALAAGATLVVMDDHTSRMGPDLIGWLRRERISVFCPPPTLLRTTGCKDPARELPDLRLLYVGGEALTDDLVDLWARSADGRPPRRLVNGYGPTECTVTVVRGDVLPGHTVTIGRPVPGHSAWVVDTQLQPVAQGQSGELVIAGPGLARGYRNRDDVTREKFPIHPRLGRIYRTGDLATQQPDGQLIYLGRIDAQVKLRGYRIELEAVEAHIARCPGVREAACCVQGQAGDALLAAHIIATDVASPPSFSAIKDALRQALPPYMVPARFGLIDTLPRSVGGKINRKLLPDLAADAAGPHREVVAPASDLEAAIVAAFAAALRTTSSISTHDDFFADLGGDSLSAVGVVCVLRERTESAAVTTRDLYELRTPARLAEHLAVTRPTRSITRALRTASNSHPAARAYPLAITIAQSLWLIGQLIIVSAVGYTVAFDLLPLLLDHVGLIGTLLLELPLLLAGFVCYTLLTIGLTVGLKWTLIGRYQPLRTPVWSGYYLRHWIVSRAAQSIPWNILAGTVFYASVLRALGATVGQRVHIHRGVNLQHGGWDLLSIGDDVTLACDAHIGLVDLDDGCLCIGPVTIGHSATLDIRSNISAQATIEPSGYLSALSWLPSGARISRSELWSGVPAAPAGTAPPAPLPDSSASLHPFVYSILQLLFAAVASSASSLFALLAIFSVAAASGWTAQSIAAWLAEPSWNLRSFTLMLAASVIAVPISLAAKALTLRWLPRVRPAVMPRWSLAYVLVTHKTATVESAGRWLSGTLFWPIWLRLAGMDIGPKCEISTITGVVPESIRIGSESFFADGIYLGGPRIHRNTVTVAQTTLARATFLGNHVVIPAGSTLPEDLFIGVCTVADAQRATPGTSWFGHPAMQLPRRDVVSVDRRLTHNPGPLRYISRLFWESLRFALPVLPLCVGAAWLTMISLGDADAPWAQRALLLAPAVTLAAIFAECLAVVALKWLLLGRAKAGQHPLWSCWCSRWDFLYVAWQFYAVRFLNTLEGTLLLAMYLRAMGVRIGRRVVLGPGFVQVADPDMIIIEDHATVGANYQAHSFEDRVLKLAPVVVRRGATVGEAAVVFYGADIGPDSWVTPNSVVMKNERLLSAHAYGGCPVQTIAVTPAPSSLAAPAIVDAAPAPDSTTRNASLDIARGVAVLGMIFMHFVPAEDGQSGVAALGAGIASFMEGKAAATFCILAGIAWAIQAQRSGNRAHSPWHLPRRALTLALVGIALHAFLWHTEILVPFAAMMLVVAPIRRAGTTAVLLAAALCLALIPAVPLLAGGYTQSDWLADGSHLTDTHPGWATLRFIAFNGHYALIPWLAFPLLGTALVTKHRDGSRPLHVWFLPATITAILAQIYSLWAGASVDSLGDLAPYLTNTWLPTSLPFMLLTGSSALAVISGAALFYNARRPDQSLDQRIAQPNSQPTSQPSPTEIARYLACFGRASLTHYLLHLCIVYAPLRAILGDDEWSVNSGLWAFAGYTLIAMPLTVLWFRRFSRGPAEALWAMASGR